MDFSEIRAFARVQMGAGVRLFDSLYLSSKTKISTPAFIGESILVSWGHPLLNACLKGMHTPAYFYRVSFSNLNFPIPVENKGIEGKSGLILEEVYEKSPELRDELLANIVIHSRNDEVRAWALYFISDNDLLWKLSRL